MNVIGCFLFTMVQMELLISPWDQLYPLYLMHTVDHHSESEEEEHIGPWESLSLPPLSRVSTMEIVEEDNQTNSLVCNVDSYEWLVEHFKSMQ